MRMVLHEDILKLNYWRLDDIFKNLFIDHQFFYLRPSVLIVFEMVNKACLILSNFKICGKWRYWDQIDTSTSYIFFVREPYFADIWNWPVFTAKNGKVEHTTVDSDTQKSKRKRNSISKGSENEDFQLIITIIGNFDLLYRAQIKIFIFSL